MKKCGCLFFSAYLQKNYLKCCQDEVDARRGKVEARAMLEKHGLQIPTFTSKGQLKCGTCGSMFRERAAYRDHCRTHDPSPEMFTCKFKGCGKKYNRKNNLKTHEKTHGALTFLCTLGKCRKLFATQGAMNKHQNYDPEHVGTAPSKTHTCKFCKAVLPTSRKKYQHQTVCKKNPKSDEKFQCGHCEKDFVRKEYLTVHVNKVHLGIRKVKCDHCREMFFDRAERAKHYMYMHPEKPVKSFNK